MGSAPEETSVSETPALDGAVAASPGTDDQVASTDEYEIALAEGVDDETLCDDTAETTRFSITSYGADYTVDTLVKRMRNEAFTIPSFQRRFVWSQRHASKFIESLLMGLPVPGIFLYREGATNKHLVIDGQQRLRTLQAYYDGLFGERKFRLIGVIDEWANKTYAELSPSDQLKLDDSIVHATIFSQDEPENALDSVYFVFERINTGGIRLTAQEIRNAIAAGPFTDMVRDLNVNADWRAIFGAEINKHSKDQELITRFLALHDDSAKYSRPMSKFLNKYSQSMNKVNDAERSKRAEIFVKTIGMLNKSLGSKAFRPSRSLNAAVFDAVMVGLAKRLENGSPPTSDSVKDAYGALLGRDDFRRYWIRATADEDSVRKRIEMATEAFAGI
ncbi:GmrSD restriction endonuclease domain-containing protein [Sphingomonas beigongshangi]|uniref:GmrSD restriction endonuclease domain-containing protein n=1 Tax=Sphingomonas beigongshangi TaxID=2782540 RepID=UPI001EEF17D8|nr:DUF262 domain-containing protein [Sphingomonas beigongshangi]